MSKIKSCAVCGKTFLAAHGKTMTCSAGCLLARQRAYGKKWRETSSTYPVLHRAAAKKFRESHPAKVRARIKKWSAENPDLVKEHGRRSREKNKDYHKERHRIWREKNRVHLRQYSREYYARRRAKKDGDTPQ